MNNIQTNIQQTCCEILKKLHNGNNGYMYWAVCGPNNITKRKQQMYTHLSNILHEFPLHVIYWSSLNVGASPHVHTKKTVCPCELYVIMEEGRIEMKNNHEKVNNMF